MKNEYRIVKDRYAGYEVQIKRWWFPVWLQVRVNSHITVEKAEAYANNHAARIHNNLVKYLGKLPK